MRDDSSSLPEINPFPKPAETMEILMPGVSLLAYKPLAIIRSRKLPAAARPRKQRRKMMQARQQNRKRLQARKRSR